MPPLSSLPREQFSPACSSLPGCDASLPIAMHPLGRLEGGRTRDQRPWTLMHAALQLFVWSATVQLPMQTLRTSHRHLLYNFESNHTRKLVSQLSLSSCGFLSGPPAHTVQHRFVLPDFNCEPIFCRPSPQMPQLHHSTKLVSRTRIFLMCNNKSWMCTVDRRYTKSLLGPLPKLSAS